MDDTEGYIDPSSEPFELVRTADLGIEDFEAMAARYDVLELSTAVKPWLLRHLLHDRGLERWPTWTRTSRSSPPCQRSIRCSTTTRSS